jgi:hypothetical protein
VLEERPKSELENKYYLPFVAHIDAEVLDVEKVAEIVKEAH